MIVQCKEEDVEKNGYTHTDRQTDRPTEMQHNDPVQYTVLGWVKKLHTRVATAQKTGSTNVLNKT